MFHFFDTCTNTKGDSLPGWQAECVQYSDGITPITIYADELSTPIINVSGVPNRAVADAEGNVDFYVAEGTYSVRYYNAAGVYQRTLRYVPMYGADSVGFYLDTDPTLAANSDARIASQKAAKAYIDTSVANAEAGKLDYKGRLDCTTNPNYPAAERGDVYVVDSTGAGRVGGASGPQVQPGDQITCLITTSAGDDATVGTNWNITRGKLVPADAYGVGWDGSNVAAAKNDVYDKIESLVAALSGSFTTASTTEVLTGTDTAKGVTPDALAALWEQGTDVAGAATVSLGEGGYFNITGTTTITDIDFATDKAGRRAWVKFAGALTLTHNASTLILPGGASITTAAGDCAEFISEGADVVRCVAYTKANGQAVVGGSGTSGFGAFSTLTDGATVTPNATSTNNFIWTIGGNRTLANPTGLSDGQEIRIIIKQDATGSRVITWGSKYNFSGGAPALSSSANAKDMLVGLYNAALDIMICSLGKGFA